MAGTMTSKMVSGNRATARTCRIGDKQLKQIVQKMMGFLELKPIEYL